MQRTGWIRSAGLSLGVAAVMTLIASCAAQPTDSADSETDARAPFGLELLAGSLGGRGNPDGTGGAAAFDLPTSVAVDGAGNVYVADARNDTIRKITPAGVVTTLAGVAGQIGSADGVGAAARLGDPDGVAVDAAGNVYVADTFNCTIRKITPAGAVTTLAGSAGSFGSADGTGAAAQFNSPAGVAVDGAGNVYVADGFNATIRKITPAGVVTTIAGTAGTGGSRDGTGAAARFSVVTGVAVDATGTLYVADQFNDTIRKIAPTAAVTTLAGTASQAGATDGRGSAARFFTPTGVAADGDGTVYVTDFGSIRRINAADNVATLAGTGGAVGSADGRGTAVQFEAPAGAAVDRASNVYVADEGNSTIRKVTTGGVVTTIAGAAGQRGSADGTGAAARFNLPAGVAVDRDGNVFVADLGNFVIRKITPAGVVTTLAGTAGMRGSVDGVGAAARFEVLTDLAIDGAGNLYAADFGANVIRKITPAGAVTTLAGAADTPGSDDGTGAAARFHNPTGVAVDHAANVYVTYTANHTLRKITPAGVVTTVAGTAGVAGIVLGPTPQLAFPDYLAIVGDSIVLSDNRAVLLLRHGAP